MKGFYKLIFYLILSILIILMFHTNVIGSADIKGAKGYIVDESKVIILVGDSRVMQMTYLNPKYRNNYILVYSNGGGINCIRYNYTKNSKYIGDRLELAMNSYPYAPVVFALGVNSNSNPSENVNRTKYYDYYIKNYPTHPYIISSVGPTEKGVAKSCRNGKVYSFNVLLKDKYITNIKDIWKKTKNENIFFYDLYDYLKSNKIVNPGKAKKGTYDGLHYKNSVYRKWLKDLRSFVEEEIDVAYYIG